MSYLAIEQLVEKYGKSPSTIRRLIKKVRKSDDQKQRRLIKPSEQELEEGEPYVWRIHEDLIKQRLLDESPSEEGSDQPKKTEASDVFTNEIIQMKDQQIADLKFELGESRKLSEKLLDYGKDEKIAFANATAQLAEAIPAIERMTSPDRPTFIPSVVLDAPQTTTPKQSVNTKKQGTASPAAVKSPPKKTSPAQKKSRTTPKKTTQQTPPQSVKKSFLQRLFRP